MKNDQEFIKDDMGLLPEIQDELDFDFQDENEEPIDYGQAPQLDTVVGYDTMDEQDEEPIDYGQMPQGVNVEYSKPAQIENTEQYITVEGQQNEPVQQENNQKQTIQKRSGKGENDAQTANVAQDIILYMVIDKATTDLLEYFRGYGVNVAHIFSNIDDAKNEIMMQIDPCRIVIVDTGTGRFSLMSARKSLVDLLGMGDEDSKISVFYTDTVVKEDLGMSEQVDNKQVDWFKYRSTPDILANLLKKKKTENYILDSSAERVEHVVKPEDLMQFKGLTTETEIIDLGQPSIKPYDIALNLDADDDRTKQLQAYAVKY